MNLILKYVIDKALKRGITDNLKHMVIIEDSQFLVPSILREVPETSLVEDIPLLLRGVGESLITISTRPEISSDIIANSGVKITFKSPYDSQKIAKYQNLSENQEKYLRIMPKREAIVTLPNYQFPFRIFTDYFAYEKKIDESKIQSNSISTKEDQFTHEKHEEEKDGSISSNFYINPRRIITKKKIIQVNNKLNMIELSKIRKILKNAPLNKHSLSKILSIPKRELDMRLKAIFEKGQLETCIAPIFSNEKKQKLYFLPEQRGYVKKEIKMKIENNFLKEGKLGKLAEGDLFDYIWYGNNTLIKIFSNNETILNISKMGKLLFNWFEAAIERGSFELIVIVPFLDWSKELRLWLASFHSNQILIFSYNIEDWKKLTKYLKRGIRPEADSNKQQNLKEKKYTERL